MPPSKQLFRDDSEKYHEQNIHIERRLVYISGDIEPDLADQFIKNINLLDVSSQKKESIHVYMNSVGGCPSSAWAMYDRIRQSECEVIGYVYGECCSAATMVLQAFDHRVSAKHCAFMFHEGEVGYDSESRNFEAFCQFHREIEKEWMYDIYRQATGIPKHKLKQLFAHDKYYTADQALELGFIDEVLENPKPHWLEEKQS